VRKLLDTVWFLPALSALFFLLAFYPFNIGVFALLALAPLRLYAARPNATNRRTFWGAAAVGASFSLLLSYVTIFQFHWVYEARIFTLAVRASVLPIVLASGALCGAALLLGRRLFSWSPVLQAAMGAAIYALAEASLSAVFRGYYFGTLAYALADWPVFRAVASFGGTPLATAAAAFASLLIAEAIAVAPERRGRFAAQVAGFAAAVLVAAAARAAGRPAPGGVAPVTRSRRRAHRLGSRPAEPRPGRHGVRAPRRRRAYLEPEPRGVAARRRELGA
jgi:apolipoprotein N-acyltransferase